MSGIGGPGSGGRPDDAGRGGRIVTFYSYKGGTGRTMALANTAWILAANGFRVLTVDWDLEAPGLAKFFHPFLDPDALAGTSGLMDLIQEYREEAVRPVEHPSGWYRDFARVRPHAVSLTGTCFPDGGSLDFLSAGRLDRDSPSPSAGSTGTSSTTVSTAGCSSTRCGTTCAGATTTC